MITAQPCSLYTEKEAAVISEAEGKGGRTVPGALRIATEDEGRNGAGIDSE